MRAHKVIESLNEINKNLSSPNFVPIKEIKDKQGVINYNNELITSINSSEKFLFTIDNIPMGIIPEFTNLPYPLCYYEVELQNNKLYFFVLNQKLPDGKIEVDVLTKAEDVNVLIPTCVRIIIEKSYDKTKPYIINAYTVTKNPVDSAVTDDWISFNASLITGFNLVMACSNIKYINNIPPDKVNKKRIKNNKIPIFTYKTLELIFNKEVIKNNNLTGEYSERKSPKLHLRRGHIRRLPNHQIWIPYCLVGNKDNGIIIKDYKIKSV